LEKTGYAISITAATIKIDYGRKGFATRGKEQEGRISYEDGIADGITSFQQAQAAADPYIMLLAEYTYISQELQFCDKSDKRALDSLNKAKQDFDDAFLALEAVGESCYKITEKTYPHFGDHRYNGFPKDAFHIAFNGHRTRINNILRSPGIDLIEKSLLKQRLDNLSAAQTAYVELQKKAMGE
jgi:hypothetical protein